MAVFNFKFVNRPRPLGAPLGDRSASNLELPHVPGGELVQLARHHMISWYQIKRCWNFLILPNIQTSNFVELREAIRNYVEFVVDDALKWDGISPITVRNATAALERLLNNIDMHSDAAGIPQAPDMPEIARIFCWNPRNIFLGPAGDGHRNYSDWITMGSGQGAPRWKRADPGHQFEEYATHIINRRGSGHFYNLREISEKIDLQMNSDNASEQDLVAFIKTMVDPAIEPVRLDVRHADWFRMNGFFEQRVWRWGAQGMEYRNMPQLANPPRPSYLVIDDPRIVFPVNDGGWQILGASNVQNPPALASQTHAQDGGIAPLQRYRPGDSITIGGKTITLESGSAEDDSDYIDAFGRVTDVTLSDAASFLAPGGGWTLPSVFDRLRVNGLSVSFMQVAADVYSWELSANISFDVGGLSVTAIASIGADSDTNRVDSSLTIQLPIREGVITIKGKFRNDTTGMHALLMADLATAHISMSDLVESFLGFNPIRSELEGLSVTPRKIWFLFVDGAQSSSSLELDFGDVKVFAGKFREGHAVALRLLTGQVAALSKLPFIGSVIPPSEDLTVTDVGLFWLSQPFTAAAVSDMVAAQAKFGWQSIHPKYPDGAMAAGMHAVAKIASKSDPKTVTIQRHLA